MNNPSVCIFYTDDDIDDREIFRDVVSGMETPCQVYLQKDGQELMDMLRNPPPCLKVIFLDLNMPRKNGLQALAEIKQSEHLRKYPVVILTTSDDPNAIATTRDLGADLFITKPGNFSVFKKAIAHAIGINWESADGHEFVYNPN